MKTAEDKKIIKCVVWDLDNTLWDGVLLEGDRVSLRQRVLDVITGLDGRGILQSIASKNDYDLAMAKLKEYGIEEYFLYPQINWNSKAASIKTISESFNIGLDSVAFIDDQPFERDEVSFAHKEVLCIDALNIDRLLGLPEMNPRFITDDSRIRRRMYISDIARKDAEGVFTGTQEEFLASLGMKLTIAPARQEDLKRAEELTIRTNQLNTTGYTYSFDDLNEFIKSDEYELLICDLEDKYGTYGKIGLALLERKPGQYRLKLLLMSCRVMSRGIGTIILNYIMGKAKADGVRLLADFVANGRNRMTYVTFKFAGFREVERNGDAVVLESDLDLVQEFPSYVQVDIVTGDTKVQASDRPHKKASDAGIYEGVLSAIGNTPLVRLGKFFAGSDIRLFAKLELLNPGGSMKDRPAFAILRRALETGAVRRDSVVIESSSGNTGIGLAQACSYFGLRFICVVDPKTTLQNINLLRAYGAEVDLVERPDLQTGEFLQARLNRVRLLLQTEKNSFWPNQYANEYNSMAHHPTMREIVSALGGGPDYLFCAVSTCGTLRGCSEYVSAQGLKTKIFAVDAVGSVIFGGGKSKRLIPGHGAAVMPKLFREGLAHQCVHVTDQECVVGCRRLARREAILAGGSSGAVMMAIAKVMKEMPARSTCVAILADRGERYLDTIYSDDWVREHFGDIANLWEEI